jgi:hypothetical protein
MKEPAEMNKKREGDNNGLPPSLVYIEFLFCRLSLV